MILHRPTLTERPDALRICSGVELGDRRLRLPPELWFELPGGSGPHLSDRLDGLALVLLPLAMALGEALEVRGALSPRLARAMEEYQHLLHAWFPRQLRVVPVIPDAFAPLPGEEVAGATGCAFSGGVDSFFTLLDRSAGDTRPPGYRITHALWIYGYEPYTDVEDRAALRAIAAAYGPVLAARGVQLLLCRTNLRRFLEDVRGLYLFQYAYSAAVLAPALLLGRLFARFYISASHAYDTLCPLGTHPMLDGLLCSDTLEVIHHGAHLSRPEKAARLSQHPETFSRLHVCLKQIFAGPGGPIRNCCRCGKCVRTMAALEAAGALGRYKSFPLPLTRHAVRRSVQVDHSARLFAAEAARFCADRGRGELARDLRYAVARSRLSGALRSGRDALRGALRRGAARRDEG